MTPPITFTEGQAPKAHWWIPFILPSCPAPSLSLPHLPLQLWVTVSLILGECPRADSSSTYSSGNIRAVVKQEHVRYAVGSCLYRVNNYLDQVYRPRPVNEIISSAREMIGAQLEYCVKDRKYKHFVTHLRYGTACSRQVRSSLG